MNGSAFRIILAGVVLLLSASAEAQSTKGLLRVICEGDSAETPVTINGERRGECPFDTAVDEGDLHIVAVKAVGDTQERRFERTMFIGAGTQKRLEIVLPPPQLTPEGRIIEETRRKAEAEKAKKDAEEKVRRDAEAARAKMAADAAERAAREAALLVPANRLADQLLASRRTAKPWIADCPDCPGPLPGKVPPADLPRSADPEMSAMLDRARDAVIRYAASGGKDFRPPATTIPLPCAEAEGAMRAMAEVYDYRDMPPVKAREYAILMKPLNALIYQRVRDVRIWTVSGKCIDGKLDGPIDYWIFANYLSAWSTPERLNVTSALHHVTVTMEQGRVISPIALATRTAAPLTHVGLPTDGNLTRRTTTTISSMRFGYAWPEGLGNGRELSTSFSTVKLLGNVLFTETFVPASPGIVTREQFFGPKRASSATLKDGRLEGTFMSIGADGTEYLSCFRDDAIVISNQPCPAQ